MKNVGILAVFAPGAGNGVLVWGIERHSVLIPVDSEDQNSGGTNE